MTYTVQRHQSGAMVKMTTGTSGVYRDEPETSATILKDGRFVTRVRLNATTMCLPEGGVYGMDATDEQIVRAVLGDEDIFTAAPSFPEHHDAVTQEA